MSEFTVEDLALLQRFLSDVPDGKGFLYVCTWVPESEMERLRSLCARIAQSPQFTAPAA